MITDDLISEVAKKVMQDKEAWLKFWMGTLTPPVVMRWTQERKNLPQISNYLERQKIRIVCRIGDPKEYLMRGNQVIASFEVKYAS